MYHTSGVARTLPGPGAECYDPGQMKMLRRTFVAGLLAALGFTAVAAPGAAAQSTLPDNTCVVVTSEGLFKVASQVTTKVFDTAPFGGVLNSPSITWIDGTDVFIVTTVDGPAGQPGGLWRVKLPAAGAASVQDLVPTLPPGIEPAFVDADYSPALDVLFVLHDLTGEMFAWGKPATANLSTLATWSTVPPGDGRSISVHGAEQPFAIAVTLASGPLLRVDKLGASTLDPISAWDDIVAQTVTGDLIVCSQLDSLIGVMATSSLMTNINVFGLCGPLVAQPTDLEWDPVALRAVAIAGEALPPCAFGGITSGENHIVRLPLTVLGGPPSNQPVLLTPSGPSGITGNRADLALVRHGGSEVTYWGFPSAGAGSSEPLLDHAGALAVGKTAQLSLKHGPPTAAALLLIGQHISPVLLQGQLILPAPQLLLPVITGTNGTALVPLALPASATSLLGLDVTMQWIVDDTTTAAGGDIASSQAAVFTVGVK